MSTPEPPAPTPSATRPRRHTLKVWPEYAAALDDGTKTFEFRRDDRTPAYAVGDSLLLQEWSPMGRDEHRPDGGYTGREWLRRVTYVARGGVIPEGYCVMSIVPPASAPACATVPNDSTCPCGTALVRDGEVVHSHWTGSICSECEQAIIEKYNARMREAHRD